MTTPRKYEILIVEDDAHERQFITSAFLQHEPELIIEVAEDGDDALTRLQNAKLPDLILFDLRMPKMDGFEFLDAIKQDPRLRSIPAIAFSASEFPDDIKRSYASFANAYVMKPRSLRDYTNFAQTVINFWLHHTVRSYV